MDVLPVREEMADENASNADTIECPVCDTKVSLDTTRCPNCGAALAMADMNDLTSMADELKNDDRSGRA
jgi:hypothetical protein